MGMPDSLTPQQLVSLLANLQPGDAQLQSLNIATVAAAIDPQRLSAEEFASVIGNLDRLAAGGAQVRLSDFEPAAFARLIAKADKEQIDAITGTPRLRASILGEVFTRMKDHFRTERGAHTSAVVHWRFTGGPARGTMTATKR
ncbi:MAG: hypothetical protein ACRDRL_14865 [Sciscionella sp.]